MKKTFFALMHRTKDTFIIEFPDIPGCITEGQSLEDAMAMADDLLATMLRAIADDLHQEIPEASDYAAVIGKGNPDFGPVAFVMPVTAYLGSRTERISMTGPEDKLELIKDFAHKCGTSRSSFMLEASMEYIAKLKAADGNLAGIPRQ